MAVVVGVSAAAEVDGSAECGWPLGLCSSAADMVRMVVIVRD